MVLDDLYSGNIYPAEQVVSMKKNTASYMGTPESCLPS